MRRGLRENSNADSLAMYGADNGRTPALMVPTEILAEQHYQSLQGLFPELEVVLLTSGMKAADKKVALLKSNRGSSDDWDSLTDSGCCDSYHRLGLVSLLDEQLALST